MKNISFVDPAKSVSLMEWNVKTSSHWDWENLAMLNAPTTDMPQKPRSTPWATNGGLDSGSIYSYAAGGSSGMNSDLGFASFSKSSKSASKSSSLWGDCKGNKFSLDGYQGIPNDFGHKKDLAKVNPPVEVSVRSGEPLLDLKLGKRTYSEDVCAEKNAKKFSSSVLPASSVIPTKRSKTSCQTTSGLHCQVEGCNLDLSSAKDYHRKHRVCENHSKSPKVVVAGVERRFCQQCSRFHSLAEFDEKKRSCRRRLSDHNARRRKPQTESTESFAYNTARYSVLPYDGKHEISFVWNRTPFAHTRPHEIPWEGMFSSKSTPMKQNTPTKVGSTNGELQLPGNDALNLMSIWNHDSTGFILPKSKPTATGILHQGMPQDMHHALSLLSTDSWGSCEPKHGSLDCSMATNDTVISQPAMQAMSQGFPLPLSENWQIQQATASQVQTTLHNDSDNHFQEFQLFRGPYGGSF